jgi:hypothetical protein
MDHKNLKSILQDALEEQIPGDQVDLLPAVQSRLVTGKTLQQGDRMNKKRTKRLVLSVLTSIIILTIALLTPQGRAWAQELAQFFSRINSMTIELPAAQQKQLNNESLPSYDLPLVPVFLPSASPEMATIAGCETPQRSQSYRCQVGLAESKLRFDLKELPEKPQDWEFQSLSFDPNSRYAILTYRLDVMNGTSYSHFMLIQRAGDFSNFAWYRNNPWEAVPTDKVELVSIKGYQGEYVMGSFSLKPSDTVLTWSEETSRQRLAWSEGDRWYLIDFRPNLNVPSTMRKEQLVHLAESLLTSPSAPPESLDPAHLTSIVDAEQISGLDLKAPTLLPMNINFSYARSLPGGKQVDLIYGDNEELIIHEQEGKLISSTFPVVKVNGEDAYFDTTEGSDAHLFLWWHKDGINYQMDFDQSFGWHIDIKKMVAIAESMGDIDDFRKKSGGYFEQVALYEQALGMNAKKFQQAPVGWVFANVWGDSYTQCIDLIYKAIEGQNTLFISQCKTDKRFDPSVFPARSIEPVNVRNTKGQYIAGDFVMGNDGKETWDPTSPGKQLYWQEDGLWIQMGVYGEDPVLQSKEDLIAYAESLR